MKNIMVHEESFDFETALLLSHSSYPSPAEVLDYSVRFYHIQVVAFRWLAEHESPELAGFLTCRRGDGRSVYAEGQCYICYTYR